jgi:hypothetical protein
VQDVLCTAKAVSNLKLKLFIARSVIHTFCSTSLVGPLIAIMRYVCDVTASVRLSNDVVTNQYTHEAIVQTTAVSTSVQAFCSTDIVILSLHKAGN